MEYDEIRISTRREISVCRDAIRKLEKTINGFTVQYGSQYADFTEDTDMSAGIDPEALSRWRDCRLALDRWKNRLDEHLRIMQMY